MYENAHETRLQTGRDARQPRDQLRGWWVFEVTSGMTSYYNKKKMYSLQKKPQFWQPFAPQTKKEKVKMPQYIRILDFQLNDQRSFFVTTRDKRFHIL